MKLALYVARAYAGALVLMQLGLVIIVVATSLMENAGYLTRSEDSGVTALSIAYYGAIQYSYQVFPVACFLALLVTGTTLARSGELLAVQAAGISPWRVGLAMGVLALLVAVIGGLAGEYVVPRAIASYESLERKDLRRGADSLERFYNRRSQWFRRGPLLLYLPNVDLGAQSFENAVIYRVGNGRIASVTDAKTLTYDGTMWTLGEARIHDIASGKVTLEPKMALSLDVTPAEITDVSGDPRVMSSHEVRELIGRRQRAGFDAVAHSIELHNRLAFPAGALCLFMLGVPWALDPSRRRSLATNLGAGVVGIGLFLFLAQFARVLALGRKLPTPLGAWGVDLLCVALVPLSFVLYRRYRTRGTLW